jgi:uroporphyrinogen III methyltransferase/synthase
VASITWGTRPEQRTVRATLSTIAGHSLQPPSTIVVGDVAAIDLAWFETRPLFGKRIIVTRSRTQASELAAALLALGAEPIELPAIEIVDPPDGGEALRAAAAGLCAGWYDWLVLTSANGVHRLFAHVPDSRLLAETRIAVIGPGTAAALGRYHVVPDLVPPRFVAESLLDAFPVGSGGRVLLARASVARAVLPDGLRAMGWSVDVVDAYATVAAQPTAAQLAAAAAADAITFTSSSTVRRYLDVAGSDRVPSVVACIGPVTAATARELGLKVTVEAQVHTINGLVDALLAGLRQ